MAVSYHAILADVSSLLGALKSYTTSNAESTYSAAAAGTLSSSDYLSTDFPQVRVQAAIIDGVMDYIAAICNTGNHPQRGLFLVSSSATASGAARPTASSGSVKFIGPVTIVDASNGKPCTPAQLEDVRNIAANENSMYGTDFYYYAFDGDLLFHTRTNVIVKGAGYDRPSFSGNIPLPDQYKPAIVSAAMTHLLPREGMYLDQLQVHAQIVKGWMDWIAQAGSPVVPAGQSYPMRERA